MYNPTAREWKLIQEALGMHGMEIARAAMGTKRNGSPLYLDSQISQVNEITALLKKMNTTPRLAIVKFNEQTESETGPGDGPEHPNPPYAA